MPASYKFLNGTTYKVLSSNKVVAVLKLTASDGRTKTFPHEFEVPEGQIITPEEINTQANALAWEFENNPGAELPEVELSFNEEIPLTEPNPAP